MIDPIDIWTVIIVLGLGSFVLRFLFLGVVGNRALPAWVLRHLRYTAVAMLPALVAQMVVWPAATGGVPDAPRAVAACVTLLVGLLSKNVILAILAGAGSFYLSVFLLT